MYSEGGAEWGVAQSVYAQNGALRMKTMHTTTAPCIHRLDRELSVFRTMSVWSWLMVRGGICVPSAVLFTGSQFKRCADQYLEVP